MDYTNRSAQVGVTQTPVAPASAGGGSSKRGHGSSALDNNRWFRIGVVAMFAVVAILILGVIFVITTSNTDNESKYVDTSKLQAVFLNTGQVYFGNIKDLNNQYFVLTNIYYLQTSSSSTTSTTSTSGSNVSLVKLGCELHMPYDQMVINRSEVTFWENLQSSGQVAKAVQSFQQANPNGQKCSDQSSSASTTSGTSAQNAGTTSTTH